MILKSVIDMDRQDTQDKSKKRSDCYRWSAKEHVSAGNALFLDVIDYRPERPPNGSMESQRAAKNAKLRIPNLFRTTMNS
jgi:hypothetical protein